MKPDLKTIWNACGEAFDRFTTADDSFSANIELPAVEALVGEVSNQRVLDLGCGSGPFSILFAQRGGLVTGIDLSPRMIALASEKARAARLNAQFRVGDIAEPLPASDSEFDLVFSGTALHYVKELTPTMREVRRVLKSEGRLVASVLHPLSTARFPLTGSDKIDPAQWEARYFGDRARSIETPWLGFGDVANQGRRLFCYHHTLSDYFTAISEAGLEVTDLCEPAPQPEYAAKNASRYREAEATPVYLIFRAKRRS